MKPNKKIKFHFYYWLAYFLFEVNADFVYLHEFLQGFSWQKVFFLALISEFTFLLSEIPAFYVILAIVDDKVSFLNNKFKKIIAVLIIFVFFTLLHRVLSHDLVYPHYYGVPEEFDRFYRFGLFNSVMNVIFAVAIGFGFEKFLQFNEAENRLKEIEKEKSETELKLLKTQINPHFLFNTLNNIYGLSLKKSDETPEIILKLAKIMRYNIFDSAKNKVSIQKEIENIQDFIDIQKIRHKLVKVEFDHSIDDDLQEISPLILLHFVENAFKHGASESRFDSFIRINLELKNKILIYKVENSKEDYEGKESTKIGFKNIKRQLELLYPKHNLDVKERDDLYSVTLKILFES